MHRESIGIIYLNLLEDYVKVNHRDLLWTLDIHNEKEIFVMFEHFFDTKLGVRIKWLIHSIPKH